MSIDGLWIGQVAMAALMNVAFAFAVGSALLGAWLAKDAQQKISPARPAWLRAQRSMLTAIVVLVLADLGWLLYQAASMSGVALPAAIGVVPTVLTQTHVGYGWSLAFAGALVLLGTAMASHTGMLRNALLWLAVIAIAAGKASLGHAADAGPASAAIAMQTLHVLVTSVWGGLAMAAGLAVLPALGTSTARGMLIRTATQVSNVSVVAVALVLLSGIFNAVRGSGWLVRGGRTQHVGSCADAQACAGRARARARRTQPLSGAAAPAPHGLDDGCSHLRQRAVSRSAGDDRRVRRGGRVVA